MFLKGDRLQSLFPSPGAHATAQAPILPVPEQDNESSPKSRRHDIDKAKLFSEIDKDGDGAITMSDLSQYLYDKGLSRDIASIFREADVDQDGKLSITELLNWVFDEAPPMIRRKLVAEWTGADGGPTLRAHDKVNVSEWFANAMAEAGVTHVYGGHGGALVPMVNAVVCHPLLTWVPTRNEANASLMAAAHAKLTGSLAVCMATSGPGATNLTTGLLEAQQDQCAVLALTGLKPREGLGYSEFQDVDQSRLFAGGGLAFSVNVASAAAFVPLLRDAVAKAVTQRACVHLAVPVDVQAAPCQIPLMPLTASDAIESIKCTGINEEVIDAVAEDLFEATHPGIGKVLIAVGHRCIPASTQILQLAEYLHAPILTRLDAKGCVDESHPLVWGVLGVHGKPGLENSAKLIQTSEIVISFGVHDSTPLLCNLAGMQIRPMIHFEPDAVAVTFNVRYHATHTVIGNPIKAITMVLDKLHKLEAAHQVQQAAAAKKVMETPKRASKRRSVSLQASDLRNIDVDKTPPLHRGHVACNEVHQVKLYTKGSQHLQPPVNKKELEEDIWDIVHNAMTHGRWKTPTSAARRGMPSLLEREVYSRFEVHVTTEHKYCHPAAVFNELSKHIGPEDVLCVDTGDVTLWASLCCTLTEGQRTLASERMGTMGYSLCAGLVASLVRGAHGRSIVVVGDGGIQMTCNELGTVCQFFHQDKDKKMIIVVFDNEILGRVVFGFKGALGCDLGPSPDFVMMAKAYGGDGALLQAPEELPGIMQRAFSSAGLFVIHALVDKTIKADMAAFKDNSIQMMASG